MNFQGGGGPLDPHMRMIDPLASSVKPIPKDRFSHVMHMGQYQLLSVLSSRLSPLNIDHSRNLPVEIRGINYTVKYTNL